MSKYKAEKTILNGYKFDSKVEAEYYKYLLKEEEKGLIKYIELQPVFKLQDSYEFKGKTVKAINYIGDFSFFDIIANKYTVIDVKGMPTEVANIKRKLFNNIYGNVYNLVWIAKSLKYSDTGWIDYFELKKLRAKNKKK